MEKKLIKLHKRAIGYLKLIKEADERQEGFRAYLSTEITDCFGAKTDAKKRIQSLELTKAYCWERYKRVSNEIKAI